MGNSDGRPEDGNLDHLSELEGSEEWKKAETFRKAEIFGRAAKAFRVFWDQTRHPEAGWRYAHCLRKSGFIDLALGLLTELEQVAPDHPVIRDELVWGLYEGRLLPAKEQGDSSGVIEAARGMVAAEASGIALRLAVFAVMGVAKSRGHWKLVSNWCDLLEPEELESRSRVTKHGNIPSDRERWYFAKLKALVQQEEWHLAADVAESACRDFPSNANFLRWKASARAGMGQLREAVELLETLRPRIAWYALADMARYSLELEDVEGAWMLGQEAALAFGQDSAKVNLWELMAKVSLALGMCDSALHHVGLMESVRRENDWPLRPSHQDLIQRVLFENGLDRLVQKSSREWKLSCRDHWRSESQGTLVTETKAIGGESLEGRVVSWDATRSFAFIAPIGGGEQIFVRSPDLPEEVQRNGARVRFQTIKHFDKRRNRDSLRAVNVEARRKG